MKNKSVFTSLFLLMILTIGLSLFTVVPLGTAQGSGTSIIGIINSDSIWTLAGSPYTLTGPTAVNTGVKLTVQPGVTVNLNGYYIQVNGTLTAIGSANSMIKFNNGILRFTEVSAGWNSQTGTGCTVQYANLVSTGVSASNHLKLDHNQISNSVAVGDASIITNNVLSSSITAGNSATFSNNQINGSITSGTDCTFLNNKIQGSISTGDSATVTGNTVASSVVCTGDKSTITNNTIGGHVNGGVITDNAISASYCTVQGTIVSNNNIMGGTVSATQQITNNIIVSGNYSSEFRVFGGYASYLENTPAIKGISGESTYISGNTLTGGGTYKSAQMFDVYTTTVPTIDTAGAKATIANNVIVSRSSLAISGACIDVSNNVITGDISGSILTVSDNKVTGSLNISSNEVWSNTISGIISVSSSSCNIVKNTAQGITICQGSGKITDNVVKSNYTNGGSVIINGTFVSSDGTGINVQGNAEIQRNLITNSIVGITVTSNTATIIDNTISNNGIGIVLYPQTIVTINNNNIQSNTKNIVLESSTENNVDATNNYWGTTSESTIGQSIYDSKNDFNLGTVTFVPFLTETNPNAKPDQNVAQPNPSPTQTASQQPENSSQSNSPTEITPEFQTISITAVAILIASVTVLLVIQRKQAKSHH
ncbi:MAG: beta strand repeat-containing protein [Candidatus Bathyarchaeia archaeon]